MSAPNDPGKAYLQQLSSGLFWDVNRAGVDPRQHRRFLIARVMDYGTRANVRLTEAFYGDAEILACLQQARSLHRKTLAYFSEIFQVPRESFRAWKTLSEGTWNGCVFTSQPFPRISGGSLRIQSQRHRQSRSQRKISGMCKRCWRKSPSTASNPNSTGRNRMYDSAPLPFAPPVSARAPRCSCYLPVDVCY